MNWVQVERCPVCQRPPLHMLVNFIDPVLDEDKVFQYWLCECLNAWLDQKPENDAEFHAQYEDMIKERWKHEKQTPEEASIIRAERVFMQINDWDWKTLLDVGAGYGDLVKVAKREGRIAYAYDIRGEFVSDKLPADKFDLVTMIHMLEHVYDPLGFLDSIKPVVGKELFVEVPALGDLKAPGPTHPILYSSWGLNNVMKLSGFAPSHVMQVQSETGRAVQMIAEVNDGED